MHKNTIFTPLCAPSNDKNFVSLILDSFLKGRLHICFPHVFSTLHCNFFYLPQFCSIKVSYKKSQHNAVNTCGNWMCKLSFTKNVQFCRCLKLHCDESFTHAFTACVCVLKDMTLVVSNQGNYFENASACSNRMLKTTVATQLIFRFKTLPSNAQRMWEETLTCFVYFCFSETF